ncbi:unnamed protein product [Acanthocheilonema viteae]|uniref:aECM cysteine-cradle domain-containing protein n=1 Tax=Acanthocheilonema viteae TaxID=6277 RepID=A0A498SQ97_ACAVI|nr:unnamed protein product [Acanthocheilonema viteae]
MHAKIIILLSLQVTVLAEEKPFLDLKKVIRGALDVVAAVPTSPSANYDLGDASQVTTSSGIQGIDPIIRERLSRLFHIPPDFVHRLAAQAGFIDYDPTTTKPFPNYCNFINSSQIITNHTVSEQQAAILQSEQQAVIFQPVIKDGHLYYQPFGVLPQGGQPKMIIYGGRLYIATPLPSEIHAQEVILGDDDMVMQNSSEMTDKNRKDDKMLDVSNEPNEETHYRRIYAQHMKAAEDAQIQTAKLRQVIVPNASSIEILEIESKARTSSPYRKMYNKELESYDALPQFDSQNKPEEINANLTQEDMIENDQHEVINFQMTTSMTPYNQNFKQYEEIDNIATDRGIIEESDEQTMTSTQQTDKFLTEKLSQESNEKDGNTEFMNEDQKMKRILALRRKMAADRKKFAERKRLLSSMKRKVNKEEDTKREIFRRDCYNIRSLAQQFGFTDLKQYVISNCAFIENYYPEFKCEEAEVSVNKCEQLF